MVDFQPGAQWQQVRTSILTKKWNYTSTLFPAASQGISDAELKASEAFMSLKKW